MKQSRIRVSEEQALDCVGSTSEVCDTGTGPGSRQKHKPSRDGGSRSRQVTEIGGDRKRSKVQPYYSCYRRYKGKTRNMSQ